MDDRRRRQTQGRGTSPASAARRSAAASRGASSSSAPSCSGCRRRRWGPSHPPAATRARARAVAHRHRSAHGRDQAGRDRLLQLDRLHGPGDHEGVQAPRPASRSRRCTSTTGEEMLAKLKAGAKGYDVIVPPTTWSTSCAQSELLEPLDMSYLPNFEYVGAALPRPGLRRPGEAGRPALLGALLLRPHRLLPAPRQGPGAADELGRPVGRAATRARSTSSTTSASASAWRSSRAATR